MTSIAGNKEERRSGFERRQFSYMIHIPERRSGKNRRQDIKCRYGKKEKKQKEK